MSDELIRLQAQVDLLKELNGNLDSFREEAKRLNEENKKMRYVLEQIQASTPRFCGSNERRLRRMIEKVLNNAAD